MNFERITKEIEGADFRFVVNQAASLKALKRAIHEQKIFKTLQEYISENEDHTQELLRHIYDLATLDTDVRYEHPYDTALAAYLLALATVGAEYAEAAAQLLIDTPKLWWARKIAQQIMASLTQKPSTEIIG